jgi:tetratricopeptide (TPR) repeat protein
MIASGTWPGAAGAPWQEPRFLRAAIMLHVDRDDTDHPKSLDREHPRACPGAQAEIAARYARFLARNPEGKDFARRFFLAMAHISHWDACLPAARRWAEAGLKVFPRDADLLLAAGSAAEQEANLRGDLTLLPFDPTTRGRETVREEVATKWNLFEEARRRYEDALLSNPGLVPARLRLGRVQWRMARGEAAQVTLEGSIAASQRVRDLYLGYLFLGRVHEDAGRLEQAAETYESALEADPEAQAAGIALAHVLRTAGNEKEAREVAAKAVSFAGRRTRRDGFWDYLIEDVSPEATLDRLRSEVRQ